MNTYDSLVDAINGLRNKGYTFEFKKEFSALYCRELDLNIEPEEFNVDESYRFEGDSSTDDNSVVYAISSTHGVKGLLIDAYGVYADGMSFQMAQKLSAHRNWQATQGTY